MANVDNGAGATGSYHIDIDSDNDATTMFFDVRRNGGGIGNTIFKVHENGVTEVFGGLKLDVDTADPNGARSGTQGELIYWDDGAGNYYLGVCVSNPSGTAWRNITL